MSSSIPVNLIRQWCYCPRKVYYFELTEFKVQYPEWVRQGEKFHKLEEKLWRRRNLSRFNLNKGKNYYNLTLNSERLGLHGVADMIIETRDKIYPVEFKLSANNKKRGDILQLTAYAILAEAHFEKTAAVGFLVGKGKVLHQIDFDQGKRQAVFNLISDIKQMLDKGLKPDSDATINQCCSCEYINFCNDRL